MIAIPVASDRYTRTFFSMFRHTSIVAYTVQIHRVATASPSIGFHQIAGLVSTARSSHPTDHRHARDDAVYVLVRAQQRFRVQLNTGPCAVLSFSLTRLGGSAACRATTTSSAFRIWRTESSYRKNRVVPSAGDKMTSKTHYHRHISRDNHVGSTIFDPACIDQVLDFYCCCYCPVDNCS